MVHPRPRYRRRSIPGPNALERRHWFGLDRFIGRGTVEEQGPPAPRLASAARGTPITAPHDPAPPRHGSERLGAGDTSKDRRRSIGAAGSARVGTSGEIKIGPRRPS
ncbi:hypothetical protein THAOC_15696 [Thalassiosira oceanica]|uniref:Uncharacterized protein n=1 Tax=Thalassiosira oceanica TaxID=159749 RepID=K0SRJ9_THAOC|nr:hypothetical protein THAOC_15696 [Thalassiosira oceanica]|eukprot:EJK63636.1 hypothetical protein THAOC_15696 [Thalassiosira oceanica]